MLCIWLSCIFSEHLFRKEPLAGYFWTCSEALNCTVKYLGETSAELLEYTFEGANIYFSEIVEFLTKLNSFTAFAENFIHMHIVDKLFFLYTLWQLFLLTVSVTFDCFRRSESFDNSSLKGFRKVLAFSINPTFQCWINWKRLNVEVYDSLRMLYFT